MPVCFDAQKYCFEAGKYNHWLSEKFNKFSSKMESGFRYRNNVEVIDKATGEFLGTLEDIQRANIDKSKAELQNFINSFIRETERKYLSIFFITATLDPAVNQVDDCGNYHRDRIARYQVNFIRQFFQSFYDDNLFREPTPGRMKRYRARTPWPWIPKHQRAFIRMLEFTKNLNVHGHEAAYLPSSHVFEIITTLGRKRMNNDRIGRMDVGMRIETFNILKAKANFDICEFYDSDKDGNPVLKYWIPKFSDDFDTGRIFVISVITGVDVNQSITSYVMKYVVKMKYYDYTKLPGEIKVPPEIMIFRDLKIIPFTYTRGFIFPVSVFRKVSSQLYQYSMKNNINLYDLDEITRLRAAGDIQVDIEKTKFDKINIPADVRKLRRDEDYLAAFKMGLLRDRMDCSSIQKIDIYYKKALIASWRVGKYILERVSLFSYRETG